MKKKNVIKNISIIMIVVVVIAIISYIIYKKDINNKDVVINDNVVENGETLNEKIEVISINKNNENIFEWEYDTPKNRNMDSSAIDDFNNSLLSTDITSSLIVKDGKIINEYFKEGYKRESVFSIQSCSKSITSALVGIAIDKGYIESVDVPIYNYFPEIQSSNNEYLKQITIKDLLMNTSGIKTVEDYTWDEWRNSDNWVEYILNNPIVSIPGTTFSYSTGNTHLISAIMQKATQMTLFDFGKKYLFDKIGMESIRCGEDAQGISDGGNGFLLNAYDMAKFAMLYLDDGIWEGEQIISKDWISESTSNQYPGYGYQWWIRNFGRDNYNTYFAQGWGGQFIFIVPEQKLIITFTSDYNDNSTSYMYWQYVNNIVDACGKV